MGTSAHGLPPFCPPSTLPYTTVGAQPRSCSPGSTGGPIQGPALLLALTDAVLALGPHFSHYAGWGPGGPDGPGHLALGL